MPFTEYLDQKLLALAFGDVSWTPPTSIYLALSTSQPTIAIGTSGTPYSFTEVTGSGYARVASSNNTTGWAPVATEPVSAYEVQNGVTLAFPIATGPWASGASIPYFGLFDAATAGNLLAFGTLNPAETVAAAGYQITFAAGQLTVTLD